MGKRDRLQIIRTMNMLAGHLLEYTPPEVKYSERNLQIGKILEALEILKKL
jgi:hypothetical protein